MTLPREGWTARLRAGPAVALLALAARGQEPAAEPAARTPYSLEAAYQANQFFGDFEEVFVHGGFVFRWPTLGVEIRGQSGLLLGDRDLAAELLTEARASGPPRRGLPPPPARRALSPEVLHQRLADLLRATGQPPPALTPGLRTVYEGPRLLYFEGDVLVFRGGIEVVRCARLWISPLDDRMVVEDAELRYHGTRGGRDVLLTMRGPRIVKEGPRWTGRDLQLTTCTAGAPHYAVLGGELELVERQDQFEVWSRGNRLQVDGVDLVPLPNAHFFTGEQTQVPLQGAGAGYSAREGARARIELSLPYNDLGGAVHEWLTGRPAHEFRGDLNLDLGWIEKRGFPLGAGLTYHAEGLYEGSTEAFWLDDDGPDRREILANIDGSPIDERNRNLIRSDNRLLFGSDGHLDLVAFHAGDPAVYSEFFGGDYRASELPETSAYLHYTWDNWLLTANARVNLDDFSYRDNRALAPSFVEELPVATLQLLSQPIATTPWSTPLVLDLAFEVGRRRRDFDPLFLGPHDPEETLRLDNLAELSAPFQLGPVDVRPFADAQLTWYDETTAGGSDTRAAFAAGVRAGTRLSRSWHWLDAEGNDQGLRHVIAPLVTFADRFRVSGDPADFRQFDATDALTEQNLVRVELRNLLQRMEGSGERAAPRDFLLLDLAQDIWPDAGRDNGGEHLGLFYYDFLVHAPAHWLPFENVAYALYGDYDWDTGLRTLDTELRFGKVAGLDWSLDWRRDAVVDGALGVGARAEVFGRWDFQGSVQYDFDRDQVLRYGLGIVRNDHDWSLLAGVSYDPFDDQVTFRLELQPRLGAPARPRDRDWFADPIRGDRFTAVH